MDDILGFLESVQDIVAVEIFVGTDFVSRNPEDNVFVWIRAHLPEPRGNKNRPPREFMVAEFESNRYRDPHAKAIREARRLKSFLDKRGYQVEIL